jgi:hypothetical protein
MKKVKKMITAVCFFCVILSQKSNAQMVGTPYAPPYMPNVCMGSTTKGTDFWVSFGSVGTFGSGILALNIATEADTRVELTFTTGNGSTVTAPGRMAVYDIAADKVERIDLSSIKNTNTQSDATSTIFNTTARDMRNAVYLTGTASGTTNRTLHIHTDKPVSVYAFNVYSYITDATILLPQTAWGTDYYRVAYKPSYSGPTSNDYEMIIAKDDNTEIKLVTGVTTTTLATLSEGQVYYSAATTDRTGRHITANKPVAYFTHNTITNLPSTQYNGDILFEQIAPVAQWGKKFLVPNAYENTYTGSGVGTNIIRVVAGTAGTTVNFFGATIFTTDGNSGVTNITANSCTLQNPGSWVALRISGNPWDNPSAYISADQPVGVAAFMTGATNNNSTTHNGDPSIAWIPALNQSVQNALISPFMFLPVFNNNTDLYQANAVHYMIIIAPTGKETLTTVNGSSAGSGFPFRYQNASAVDITTADGVLPADAKLNGGALNESGSWKTNAEAGYSYYVWRFKNPTSTEVNDYLKTFKVTNPYGVIVLAGGVGLNESYYYNAGSGTCGVN